MLPRYTAITCIGKRNWSQIHRPITRFFSKSETHNDDINDYLSTLGYTDSTMKVGMRDALQSVFGNQMTLSQVKGFGEEGMFRIYKSQFTVLCHFEKVLTKHLFFCTLGLQALSKSVEKQQASQCTNSFVGTVHINIPHHNYSFDLKVRKGESIMSCVKFGSGRELLGEYLEFACGGE
jgi:hypothetical protein